MILLTIGYSNAARAAGRKIARKHHHRGNSQRSRGDSKPVGRLDAEKLRLDQTRGGPRAAPIATPIAASSRTLRVTIQTTEPVSAPSAMRMPISRLRRASIYAV